MGTVVPGRGSNSMGTLLLTQTVLSAVCRGPQSFHMALGATTETTGKKVCPQDFTCMITGMVNHLNIHCDVLDFSSRFKRGRESKQLTLSRISY